MNPGLAITGCRLEEDVVNENMVISSGSNDGSEFVEEELDLIDEYYPLGEVSNKRVRLALLDNSVNQPRYAS